MSETDVRSDQHDFQSPANMLWILQELYFCVSSQYPPTVLYSEYRKASRGDRDPLPHPLIIHNKKRPV